MSNERQELDMETEISSFYNWMQTNDIQTKEIVLWHAIMNLSHTAGWVKWACIARSTLESKTGLKKDALYEARDNLEKLGRLEIITGKGNRSPKYRIIPFGEVRTEALEKYQEECNKDITQNKVSLKDEDNNSLKEKTENTEQPPIEPIKELREGLKMHKKMQTLIPMPSPKDISVIGNYIKAGLEDELLCLSIDIANRELKDKKNVERWNFAKGIMRNWYNNNIKTVEEYLAYEKEREENKKNGKSRSHDEKTREDDDSAHRAGVMSL